MSNVNGRHRSLPSREIAYAYTVAMCFAQQFEQNLRAILHTAHYHVGIEPNRDERKRYGPDFDQFIDAATCGALISKVRTTATIEGKGAKSALKAFDRSCEHRNRLAHHFLAEQEFAVLTVKEENKILCQLADMTRDLYRALLLSAEIRRQAEHYSDEQHKITQKMMKELMGDNFNCEDFNRRHATRKRKK